jgi:hypothetical protein
MEIATPSGPARVELDDPGDPAFLLVMTHGANGGVDTPDLDAVRAAALELGGAEGRVLQPFRLAGRRAPRSTERQDEAWLTAWSAAAVARGSTALLDAPCPSRAGPDGHDPNHDPDPDRPGSPVIGPSPSTVVIPPTTSTVAEL